MENKNFSIKKIESTFPLWQLDLNLNEIKILNAYLLKIKDCKFQRRTIIFEKGELEELMGVDLIQQDKLERSLGNLLSCIIEFTNFEKKDELTLISLFSKATCEKDENNLWRLELVCTPEIIEYISKFKKIECLKDKSNNIIQSQNLQIDALKK